MLNLRRGPFDAKVEVPLRRLDVTGSNDGGDEDAVAPRNRRRPAVSGNDRFPRDVLGGAPLFRKTRRFCYAGRPRAAKLRPPVTSISAGRLTGAALAQGKLLGSGEHLARDNRRAEHPPLWHFTHRTHPILSREDLHLWVPEGRSCTPIPQDIRTSPRWWPQPRGAFAEKRQACNWSASSSRTRTRSQACARRCWRQSLRPCRAGAWG